MEITSVRNPLLQSIRRAVKDGRTTEEGLIVAEGPHLLEEAQRGMWRIAKVVTTPAGRSRHATLLQRLDAELVEVGARAFESITGTQHSQQVLTLLEPRMWNWTELNGRQTLIVALDGMQDPGNAGTIIRSAEGFGATGIVLLKGAAHVSNGKLLRASAGSVFRMPLLESVSISDFLAHVRASGIALYALDAPANTSLTSIDLTRPLALLAGNEGAGVSPELLAAAQPVSVPAGRVESLNAAVACSVALFAAQQQRSAA
ncbi:MAG: RNA methyltransferase [Acidobacteriaceae bacterium]|nr:RNA methyltransferase [Acidobacteriaceae bacterium]